MSERLNREFFKQDSKQIAKGIIGRTLVRRLDNGEILSGTIEETMVFYKDGEITWNYSGMLQEPGRIHIYEHRGQNFLNISTEDESEPWAVHISNVSPVKGMKIMKKHRKNLPQSRLADGPGKVTKAFQIDRSYNGRSIYGRNLWIEGEAAPASKVVRVKKDGLADICKAYYALRD